MRGVLPSAIRKDVTLRLRRGEREGTRLALSEIGLAVGRGRAGMPQADGRALSPDRS